MSQAIQSVRWRHVAVLASRRMRPIFRSPLVFLVGLFVVIASALMLQTPRGESSVVSVFFLSAAAALALGAGALAAEIESGGLMLDRLHGARTSELVLGVALQVVTLVFIVFASVSVLVFSSSPSLSNAAVFASLAIAGLELLAFVALLVLFGALLPGSGNTAIVIALVVLSSSSRALEGAPIPTAISKTIAAISDTLPLGQQVAAFSRSAQSGGFDFGPVIFLGLSTPIFLGLTILVVSRRELAKGWRR